MMGNIDTKQLLAEEGWSIECESPFEIRHEDGSFATQNAARRIVACLREQERQESERDALRTIKGCAAIAKQSCDGQMHRLWQSIEAECDKALGR